MAKNKNRFNPSYAVPPGWILAERLDTHNVSHADFARRCDRSPELISEIIAGKAPLDQETALQFETVLGVSVNIWLGIERKYRLKQERDAQTQAAPPIQEDCASPSL